MFELIQNEFSRQSELIHGSHKRLKVYIEIYKEIFSQLIFSIVLLTREKDSNTPTGASTNPKIFDLNKNLNMNLI